MHLSPFLFICYYLYYSTDGTLLQWKESMREVSELGPLWGGSDKKVCEKYYTNAPSSTLINSLDSC